MCKVGRVDMGLVGVSVVGAWWKVSGRCVSGNRITLAYILCTLGITKESI